MPAVVTVGYKGCVGSLGDVVFQTDAIPYLKWMRGPPWSWAGPFMVKAESRAAMEVLALQEELSFVVDDAGVVVGGAAIR